MSAPSPIQNGDTDSAIIMVDEKANDSERALVQQLAGMPDLEPSTPTSLSLPAVDVLAAPIVNVVQQEISTESESVARIPHVDASGSGTPHAGQGGAFGNIRGVFGNIRGGLVFALGPTKTLYWNLKPEVKKDESF